jgi:release factor glutamine methyltransferase
MKAKELFDKLVSQISVYDAQEAREIVFWLMEHFLKIRKIDIISDKDVPQLLFGEDFWDKILNRINANEPIQYIIGETTFFGRTFLVNPSVLIPRPETEELIENILKTIPSKQNNLKVLDIGTGSGCIAVTLAKELPNAEVWAYDVSDDALKTAQKNATLNHAKVNFEKHDILQYLIEDNRNKKQETRNRKSQTELDLIVSNPPYVTKAEAAQMRKNVLEHEPHLALFVEDNDPLIFYVAIAKFAQKCLKKGGLVALEINETLGESTVEVFRNHGFEDVRIIKDIFKKDRMVLATQNLPKNGF